jgi:uncharacterized membrane protein
MASFVLDATRRHAMWAWHDVTGWEVLWMTAMMLFVWVPIVIVALWLATVFGRRSGGSQSDGGPIDARETARQAYARGDIDRERYLQIIRDLEETSPRGAGV